MFPSPSSPPSSPLFFFLSSLLSAFFGAFRIIFFPIYFLCSFSSLCSFLLLAVPCRAGPAPPSAPVRRRPIALTPPLQPYPTSPRPSVGRARPSGSKSARGGRRIRRAGGSGRRPSGGGRMHHEELAPLQRPRYGCESVWVGDGGSRALWRCC